jgi:hypothetical protein
VEAFKNLRQPMEKQDDMQIIINNPANVDVTSRQTIEAVKAMSEHFEALKDAVAVPPAPPVIHVNVPEQNVTFAPVIQPADNVNQITVQSADNVNQITVQPADVEVNIPKPKREKQKIKRDKKGNIESTETEIEY